MDSIVIEVKNISFGYQRDSKVIDNISFSVKSNEKIGIIGPNGVGKTTLILLLCGILKPNTGSIIIEQIPLTDKNINLIKPKIGLVFQDPDNQLFCTTLYEDIEFGPKYLKNIKGKELQDIVNTTLKTINLYNKKEFAPFHLSFGEKKRAALGTVISYEPNILILDEPTSNLDPKNRRILINLFKQINKTLLIVSHDLDFILTTCTRTILLNKGKIVKDSFTKEVLTDKELLEENDLELPLCLQKIEL